MPIATQRTLTVTNYHREWTVERKVDAAWSSNEVQLTPCWIGKRTLVWRKGSEAVRFMILGIFRSLSFHSRVSFRSEIVFLLQQKMTVTKTDVFDNSWYGYPTTELYGTTDPSSLYEGIERRPRALRRPNCSEHDLTLG